jgi:hypothetical protein
MQRQGPWSLSDANVRIFPERTGLNELVLRDKIEDARSGPGMTRRIVWQDYYILILLLYDVFTTGSTLHACFVALRSVFPPSVRISVATLAFVGEA